MSSSDVMNSKSDLIVENQPTPPGHRLVCDFDEKSTDDRIMMRISKQCEVQDRLKQSNTSNCRVTRQMNLCSTCGTYYGNWSLFLHMHEVHNKCICLHCHGVFPNVDKLVNHLKSKHQIDYVPYISQEHFVRNRDITFLMCVQCQQIFSECDSMLLTHSCNPTATLISSGGSGGGAGVDNVSMLTPMPAMFEKSLDDKIQTLPIKQYQQQMKMQNHHLATHTPTRRKRPSSSHKKLMPDFFTNSAVDNNKSVAIDNYHLYENGRDSNSSNQIADDIGGSIADHITMISQTKTQKLQTPLEQQALVGDQRKVPKFTLKLPPKLKISNQIESNDLYSEKVNEAKIADESIQIINLSLDQPLDRINIVELTKQCLRMTYSSCIFCNHARRIAVNGKYLGLHLIAEHRFAAVVNSITAEELFPDNFVQNFQNKLDDLDKFYINLIDDEIRLQSLQKVNIECLQCRVQMDVYKELHNHNKKLHSTSIMICIICKSSFFNYSDLLGHLCPGKVTSQFYEIPYRCYLCDDNETLPSTFRLMVHFRKKHNLCELCLEFCDNQTKLAAHVLKHKFNHFCYRCCIAYRNKPDIIKHLFWKHGTESKECKRCLQKKWPHIYHFCLPPATFTCEECNLLFTRPVSLKVHQRFHTKTFPYECTQEGCQKQFVSKKLQQKHINEHLSPADIVSDISDKKLDGTKPDNVDGTDSVKSVNADDSQTETVLSKKKRRKQAKKMRELAEKSVLEQLPALNLSESGSDSDDETQSSPSLQLHDEESKIKVDPINENVEPVENCKSMEEIEPKTSAENVIESSNELKETIDAAAETPKVDDQELDKILEDSIAMEKEEISVVENVWDNFKSFLDQTKVGEDEKVVLSDNVKDDFVISKRQLLHISLMDHDYFPTLINGNLESRKKLNQSSTSSSDSDSSSSDSDSCGHSSNCSCTSSNSSTSMSSSSSSDNEYSTAKWAKKKEVVDDAKKKEETKIELPPEYLILETDLDTDESADSDTEEFYDKQPATVGNKFMKEKKADVNEDDSTLSRHQKKKKKKSKKKNREKNHLLLPSNFTDVPLGDLGGENNVTKKHKKSKKHSRTYSSTTDPSMSFVNSTQTFPTPQSTPYHSHFQPEYQNRQFSQQQQQQQQPHGSKFQNNYDKRQPQQHISGLLSMSSSMDDSIRTSKRRRIPNRFYGYSSDEENASNTSSTATTSMLMKPTPPPNFKWRKSDLPTPAAKARNSWSSSSKIATSSPVPTTSTVPSIHLPAKKTVPTLTIKNQQIVVPRAKNFNKNTSSTNSNSSRNGGVVMTASPRHGKNQRPSLITKIKTNSCLNNSYYHDFSASEQESEPEPEPEGSSYVNSLIKSSGLDLITSTTPSFSRNKNYSMDSNSSYLKNRSSSNALTETSTSLLADNSLTTGYDPGRLYCHCQCPYDEVSEMIACDSKDCEIEWFHFECVGIMVPPKGHWFCPDCRKRNFLKSKAAAEAEVANRKL